MNRQERELRLVIREMLNEADLAGQVQQTVAGAAGAVKKAFEDLADSDGQYKYRVFPNGALQIIKSPKNLKVSAQNPLTVSTKNPAYAAIIGSLKSLYTSSTTLLSKPFEAIKAVAVNAAKAASDALAPDPNAPVTTDPGLLKTFADAFSKVSNAVVVLDRSCAPSGIPLWVYPFMCFLVLRRNPMVIKSEGYLQALHRICDAAWARGSRNLAGPGDIATAQNGDPAYNGNKQGIVGADISFAKDWSQGYDYSSTNPYMHIAMSLTNFSFKKNTDGTYTFSDNYDFNHPKTTAPPLRDPKFMLQNAIARSQILKTATDRFANRGIFAGIEDLMRYYEATLDYGGFQITGTTMIPPGYKPAQSPKSKKPAVKATAAAPKPKA